MLIDSLVYVTRTGCIPLYLSSTWYSERVTALSEPELSRRSPQKRLLKSKILNTTSKTYKVHYIKN